MLQWCRNLGGGCQHIERVSTAEKEAIKRLVHLHLAGCSPSSLQSQLPGELEPFFPLLFLLRGCSEHATFPFLSPLQGGSPPLTAAKDVTAGLPAHQEVRATMSVLAGTGFPDVPPRLVTSC
ncbi:hypothetical protein MHYP_G00232130 [Metynnis hypsauchen]